MRKLLTILVLLLCTASAFAKTSSEENEALAWGIFILPQYAASKSMRVDFDKVLNNNSVITLSPMFSFARNSSLLFGNSDDSYGYYDEDFTEPQDISITGGGVKFMIRHFFGDFKKNSGLYFGGGVHYKYSHIEYDQKTWVEQTSNGDNYIHYEDARLEQKIHQFGFDVILGYQLYMVDNIFIDVYGGWGLRLSNYDEYNTNIDYWGETIFDAGYKGYLPLLGLRLGLYF